MLRSRASVGRSVGLIGLIGVIGNFAIKINKIRIYGSLSGILPGVVDARIAARASCARSNFCDSPPPIQLCIGRFFILPNRLRLRSHGKYFVAVGKPGRADKDALAEIETLRASIKVRKKFLDKTIEKNARTINLRSA